MKNTYIIQLDGIRALAVLMVMISHFVDYNITYIVPLGSMGVNLFFVLSGFLITRILLNEKDEITNLDKNRSRVLKNFYLKRVLRIFPIYYFTIFTFYFLNYFNARELVGYLLTYSMNIKFALPGVWESGLLGRFDHFWSLCVEEQFYLFFPLLVIFIRKKRMLVSFYALIFIGVFTRFLLFAYEAPPNSLYVLPFTCLDAFGIGSLLAYYWLYDKERLTMFVSKKYFLIFSIAIFILSLVISRYFIEDYKEARTVSERFLFSLVCFSLIGIGSLNLFKGVFGKILESKILVYIGKISYGLYVYHNFAPFIFMAIVRNLNSPRITCFFSFEINQVLGYFIVTFIGAALSWKLIESPILNLKKKLN